MARSSCESAGPARTFVAFDSFWQTSSLIEKTYYMLLHSWRTPMRSDGPPVISSNVSGATTKVPHFQSCIKDSSCGVSSDTL